MNTLHSMIDDIRQTAIKRKKAFALMTVLSLIVLVSVCWQLRFIGITMTDEALCGMIEHTHTEECISERVLVCDIPESEGVSEEVLICDAEEHVHGDGCYEEKRSLACENDDEDHEHSDGCYDIDTELTCSKEEHTHGEECFETAAAEGHHHDDSCYEEVYSCGYETEHTHDAGCYKHISEDRETTDEWEEDLPELTGVWAYDVVSIAASQLGYAESEANINVTEDESEESVYAGYTKYGDWYGNKYAPSWSALFASFCLNYADVPEEEAPRGSGAVMMYDSRDKTGALAEAGSYRPVPGDLVFTDDDGDGECDRVGIFAGYDNDRLVCIEGDVESDGQSTVDVVFYDEGDESLLGYGVLPEQEDAGPADVDLDAILEYASSVGSSSDEEETYDAAYVLKKSCSWDDETHSVTYTVDINPVAGNLVKAAVPGSSDDVLKLKDVLSYTAETGTEACEAVLDNSSVTVEREVGRDVWETVQNVSWNARPESVKTGGDSSSDAKAYLIEAELPDQAHLRLSYSYSVTNGAAGDMKLVNTASIEGYEDEQGVCEHVIKGEETVPPEEPGDEVTYEYQVAVTDSAKGTPLAGAVFTAYKWDNDGGWTPAGKTYTTDENGLITINGTDNADGADESSPVYSKNTAYCVIETSSPDGYLLPEEPQRLLFWFSDEKIRSQGGAFPEGFTDSAADLSSAGVRSVVTNVREKTYSLPETGGSGINFYYLSGILLMLAAVSLLIYRFEIIGRGKRAGL